LTAPPIVTVAAWLRGVVRPGHAWPRRRTGIRGLLRTWSFFRIGARPAAHTVASWTLRGTPVRRALRSAVPGRWSWRSWSTASAARSGA